MPTIQACHRRFQEWARSGALEAILKAPVQDMKEDGTFVIAKRGPRGRKNQAGQRDKGHNLDEPLWSSHRHIGEECFAA